MHGWEIYISAGVIKPKLQNKVCYNDKTSTKTAKTLLAVRLSSESSIILFPIGVDFYQFEIVLMPPATDIKSLNIYILITQNLPLLITRRLQ